MFLSESVEHLLKEKGEEPWQGSRFLIPYNQVEWTEEDCQTLRDRGYTVLRTKRWIQVFRERHRFPSATAKQAHRTHHVTNYRTRYKDLSIVRHRDRVYCVRDVYGTLYVYDVCSYNPADQYSQIAFMTESDSEFMKTCTRVRFKDLQATIRDCLACRIKQSMVYTAEQRRYDEEEHLKRFRKHIQERLNSLMDSLYSAASEGRHEVVLRFDALSERTLTDSNKVPIRYEYPCVDGTIRKTFSEYLVYLFYQLYPKHLHSSYRFPASCYSLTDDEKYIACQLYTLCKQKCSAVSYRIEQVDESVLPRIVAYICVDVLT